MSSYSRRESSERSTERYQQQPQQQQQFQHQYMKKSEKDFEWNNQLQNLESELEEKIKKEKQMCNQINDLKEDLEKKLKEMDENQSIIKDANATKRYQSRKNVFGTFKQKINDSKESKTNSSSNGFQTSTIKKKSSTSPIRDTDHSSNLLTSTKSYHHQQLSQQQQQSQQSSLQSQNQYPQKQQLYGRKDAENRTPPQIKSQTQYNYTELKSHISSKSANNILLRTNNKNEGRINNNNVMIDLNNNNHNYKNSMGNSIATEESKDITYTQLANERMKSGERIRANLEQERQLLLLKQANEMLEKDLKRFKANKSIDAERYELLQKENITLLQKLKELEMRNQTQLEKIKDIEWENNKLIDEVNLKDQRVKLIKDNDEKVKEYQEKYELKQLEIQALQRQIDSINEKHLQFKLQIQSRDSDIKNEIKTSELIIKNQEQEIQNLNDQISELQVQNNALLREQQSTTEIEEDWKNEVSNRIQKEKEIDDLYDEIKHLKEDHSIKEVQQQGKMLLLFSENERLHQIIMNLQMEVKTLKGQLNQYQLNTFNISFNSANKNNNGQNNNNGTADELEKVKLHLQVKIKENENLRNQVNSLEQCPQLITELERKLKLQMTENQRLTQIMYGRCNEKW